MTEHHFETHRPVDLYVETGKGSVRVVATDTTETRVEIVGREADQVQVGQDGDQVTVIAPKQRNGFLGGDSRLDITVTVPSGSDLSLRSGSADVVSEGVLGQARVKSGSGDVHLATVGAAALLETGSGDVRVQEARGELRVKSGSGDVTLGRVDATLAVSTGSGDVEVGASNGPTVVKTGSGDLRVAQAGTDVSLSTGSGDLVIGSAARGRVTSKGASGDVRIGIPAGVPVWTDISTVSGKIRSDLSGAGEPQEGSDHVEVRAKTVSGDVLLTQA